MSLAFAVSTIFKSKDEQSANFNRMGKNAKKFGETTSRAFNRASKSATSFSTITKSILAAGAIQKGINLLGQGLGVVTTEFLDFDNAITQSSAKFKGLNLATKEGQKTLLELKKAARETGAETKFSAGEAAAGLDFYATAGFNAAQAMAVLKPTAKLATIANLDLARTSDIASDSLGAFGLMTKDSTQLQKNFTRISDVMAKTMTSTNTNMEDMFEAIKKGAPTFTAAGQSIETFSALMGVMANSGVKGSEAGTQLRNVMLRLAKPTKESAGVLAAMNVQTADSKGNFRDVVDILADFEKGLKGMGSEQRTAALATVFGARSVTGISILLKAGTKELRKFRGELDNSAGATDAMAKIMDKSLTNRLLKLKSAAIEVGFQLFSAFGEKGGDAIDSLAEKVGKIDLTPFIEGIRRVAGIVSNLFERFRAFGERTGLFDSLSRGLNAIIPLFKTFFSIAKTAFNLLEKAGIIDLLAHSIGLLVDTLAFLADKFTAVWNAVRPFFEGAEDFSKGVSNLSGVLGFDDEGPSKLEQIISTSGDNQELLSDAAKFEAAQKFQGQLNISGAPEGSTFTPGKGSDNSIDVVLLGAS